MAKTPGFSFFVLSDTRKRILSLCGAAVLLFFVNGLPSPSPIENGNELIELTNEGKACLAILMFAITLWVSEAVPFPITSLFVLVLIPAFGISDYESVVRSGFGNPLITFFIGVLFLSTGSRVRVSARV